MDEEKDLNFFINEAYRRGMSPVQAQNMMVTFGVSQEDQQAAFDKLSEISPAFRSPEKPKSPKVPLLENANAVFSEDDSWWDQMSKSFSQGADMQKEQGIMSSIVNEGAFGGEVDTEETRSFANALNAVSNVSVSPEMKKYQQRYENRLKDAGDDPGWFSDIVAGTQALIDTYYEEGEVDAGLIGQIFSQSMGAYATTENLSIILGSTAAGAGIGAMTGAGAGTVVPGVGNVAGGIGGALTGAYQGFRLGSSIVGGIVEAQSATAELVLEQLELRGMDYTEANLNKILNDDEAMFEVVKSAAARGVAIGSVEFITQGLAGKATTATTKTLKGGRAGLVGGIGVGVGVEAVGGGLGEIAGTAAAGQEFSGSDVIMEAIGGTATAPVSVLKGALLAPSYSINGEKVSGRAAYRMIEEATPEQLTGMKVDIKRDEALGEIYKSKVQPIMDRRAVIQNNADLITRLSDEDAEEFINTALELEKQQKSKGTDAKAKAEELQAKIDEISGRAKENPVSPETTAEDASGAESDAKSESVSEEEKKENSTKGRAEQNTEGEELSKFDESMENQDGTVSIDTMGVKKIQRAISKSTGRLREVNAEMSRLLTEVQDQQNEDGSVGGPQAMSAENQEAYRSLEKERASLESSVSKLRGAAKRASKNGKPIQSANTEERDNSIEMDLNNLTEQDLDQLPMEFRRLLSNVINKAFASFKNKLPATKLFFHKDVASLNRAVRKTNGGKAMKSGEVTFGWYHNGEVHMLDVTNPEVKEQLRAQSGDNSFMIDSPVDLVAEEVAFHFAMESILSDANIRGKFVSQLLGFAKRNMGLKRVMSNRIKTYFPGGLSALEVILDPKDPIRARLNRGTVTAEDIASIVEKAKKLDPEKAAVLEEELIAGFVRDYINRPGAYTSVWQKIADFLNKIFGKNIIKNKTDLRRFARTLARAIDGEAVEFEPGAVTPSGPKKSKQDFTYLKDETLYYDFDRQAGVAYMEWATKPPAIPQKIKVKDYFHYRNWYNKMTANQEYPGIITNVYFIKDGKKHMVKPPRPKTDADGKKVKMERIPTNRDLRTQKALQESEQQREYNAQYSELTKELGKLWQESYLPSYTFLPDFYPELTTPLKRGENDFEGAIIAKKNVQALLDSDITEEQLKELRGFGSGIYKSKNPEIYNMSGLVRFDDAANGDAVAEGEVKFAKQETGYLSDTEIESKVEEMAVELGWNLLKGKSREEQKDRYRGILKAEQAKVKSLTEGKEEFIGSPEELIGKQIRIFGYDALMFPGESLTSGIKVIRDLKIDGKNVITSHIDLQDANKKLNRIKEMALQEYLKNGEKSGFVAIGFTNLSEDAVSKNPYLVSKVSKELLDAVIDEKISLTELNEILTSGPANSSITVSNMETDDFDKFLSAKQVIVEGDNGERSVKTEYNINIDSIDKAKEFLGFFIDGKHGQGFTNITGDFVGRTILALNPDITNKRTAAWQWATKNNFVDPSLSNETAGRLLSYTLIPYTVDESESVNMGLEVVRIKDDIGFNGAIVSTETEDAMTMKFLSSPKPLNEVIEGYTKSKAQAQTAAGYGQLKGTVAKASKAAGRMSSKLAEYSGDKGVSVNQILQVAGKASKAEQAVLEGLVSKFPGARFISKDEFDQYFEGKMLQPLDEVRDHADYGLDRLYGRRYRRLVATTVPFLGDPEIYGTAGVYEDHFDYPVHAHVRMFTDPEQPGILYVSELQSDTYQKGLEKSFGRGQLPDSVIIQEYASDEFDVSVQNLEFLKHILENYDDFRAELISAAGGKENAFNADWWDDVLKEVENVSDERAGDAPNVASLLSNTVKNDPNFNVRALRILLRQFAMSNLNAPVNSTEKQIEDIINDHFNKYPFVQPGEKNNLGSFASDLVITIDYMADAVADIAIGEELVDASQEERMAFYDDTVKVVERHRETKNEEVIEGVSSAKNSWEKQIIRYAIKRAQENGDKVVRLPTEKTAADVQWWDADDADLQEYMSEEFGVDTDMGGPMTQGMLEEQREKQGPLRKRYRELPKTLRSIGLETRVVSDENGNKWYEVDTPPSDMRMAMFSKDNSRNNLSDVGGATWEMRTQDSTQDFIDKWLVRFQDKYRRVFKLQEDVASTKGGQVSESQDFRMAEERMYGRAANDLEILDNETKKIATELKKRGLSVEDLDEYLYALHAKERNAVIRERTEGKNQSGSGKTDEWADSKLRGYTSEQRADLEAVASIVRGIQQRTRNTMVELGLETQETIDAFEEMFENYVPLQGKAVDEEDIAYTPYPNGGTGFSVTGDSTKRAKGRFTETTNIVAQVVSQNAAVSIKGRTNEAMNSLYNLVDQNPNPSVWQILDKETNDYKNDDPNIVSVRVDGKQKAIRFKDASYAQSLRSMNLPQKNLFVKALGSVNSWLRAAFTSRNPEFVLSNFSRDIQSAVFNASAEAEIEGGFLNGTGAMSRIFKLVGPTLKALVRDEIGKDVDPDMARYYAEFKEDGGKTGWAYQRSLEDIASDLEIDDSGKTNAQKVIGGVKSALEFVEGINDAFENSIRLSSYIAAREAGVSRGKAAQFAKNITVNFNKQGEWGAAMNATYLFFNASVQGSARIVRSLGNIKPPIKPDGVKREWYERATTAQKAALGMVLMNSMLTLINRAASDEDEDNELFYNKIPDYVKERNIIIMRPDGKNYWKIPMPYGYNIFANVGSTAVEVASGDKQAIEGLAFLSSTLVNAFSPISFGQSDNLMRQAAKTSIPTSLKPIFEAFAFNETYFGGPVMAEQYPFGTPKPNSSMSFRSPEEVKFFFSWLNEATGGSNDVPGMLDINPDGTWYLIEYFMGGTGRFVERTLDTGRKIVSDSKENPIDLEFNDVPFMRIVYGEPSKYYDMQNFKEREVKIKQLAAEYKNNRIPNAPERYKGVSSLNNLLKSANKQLKAVRAEKRNARTIRDYAERVSKLQALQERERKIIMIFNKRYEEIRGKD